jgi:hypothetical protein
VLVGPTRVLKNLQKNVARAGFLCESVCGYKYKGTDMDASQLRKELQHCHREFDELLRVVKQRRPMVRGNCYNLRRKCGKDGCRCQNGQLHESWVLSVSEKGRTRMQVIPKGKRAQWQSMTERYRRFRRARARLVKLFAEIIKLVDKLEEERIVPPPMQKGPRHATDSCLRA